LSLLLLLQCPVLKAQFAEHFDARTIWGAKTVYQIYSDKSNFLWFSTSNGLLRFDGTYLVRYDESKGLPDNTVYKCYEDSRGRIWAFCGNGAVAFIQNGRVHHRENDPQLRSFPAIETYINRMAETDSGNFYITTHNHQLIYWNWKKSTRTFLNSEDGLVVYPNKIEKSSAHNERFVEFYGNRKLSSDGNSFRIYENGVLIKELRDARLVQSAHDISLTPSGELIVATYTGAWIINLETNERRLLLPNIETTGCTVDFQGNIWISTTYDGVYRFHPSYFSVQSKVIPDSSRWISTAEQLYLLEKNGQLQLFSSRNNQIELQESGLSISQYEMPMWIKGDRIAYFNPLKYEFIIRERNRTLYKSNLLVKKVFERQDTLLTIEANSISLWQPAKASYRQFWHSATLTDKRITAATIDNSRKQVYFVAGDKLMSATFTGRAPMIRAQSPELQGAQEIACTGGRMLIAGRTAVLFCYDLKQRTLQKFLTPERLLQILPLSGDTLLLRATGDDYLVHSFQFDKAKRIYYPFSLKSLALFPLPQGYLVGLSSRQVTSFHWHLLNQRHFPLQLYAQRLSVNGKEYRTNQLQLGKQPSLNIQISVGVLNFSGGSLPLRYRLITPQGAGAWTGMQGSELNISLPEIAPHKIEIALADDNASENVLRISLDAHPPFLQSKTFYWLCLVLTILVLTLGILWDTRRQKRKHRTELEYLKLEHRSINALLNPHFLFNAISNIQGLINKSEKHLATEYLAVLSRLMRQNLENLKENLIPLHDEIVLIERYIRLQNLRFSDRIELQIDNKLRGGHSLLIPPLLLHTFVENAIVHGFRPGLEGFLIRMELIALNEDYVAISVYDNGVGFNPEKAVKNDRENSSFGIEFNRKRLERISGLMGLKQSISISDRKDEGGKGTKVTIILYRHLKKLQDDWKN
jgi:hypothetical protein